MAPEDFPQVSEIPHSIDVSVPHSAAVSVGTLADKMLVRDMSEVMVLVCCFHTMIPSTSLSVS